MPTPVQFKTEFASIYASWGIDALYNWGVANGIHLYPPTDTWYPQYYYDCPAGAWKMYDYYNSIGDTTNRDLCPRLASMGFRQYLAYYNSTTPHGATASWNMFPEGLYYHSFRATDSTERAQAKQALVDLNANVTFTNYSDPGPTAYLQDFFASRECAYLLKLRIYNYLAGNSALDTAACAQFINWIIGSTGHFNQWKRVVSPPVSPHIYMRPFMVMISCKCLITYHDKIAPIPNLFTSYIIPMWDYIYDTAAYYNVGSAGSMYPVNGKYGNPSLAYTDVNTNAAPFQAGDNGYGTENTDTGGVGGTIFPDSVDLSWFIAPLLWRIYKETGVTKWRTRGDNLWNNALPIYNNGPSDYSQTSGIYLGNQAVDTSTYPGDTIQAARRRGVVGKHVDQSYWWSTDGFAWAEASQSSGGATGVANSMTLLGAAHTGVITYGLSGTITVGGVGLGGVTVTLSGGSSATTTTDGTGFYSFANFAPGTSVTATPTLGGYTFSPTNSGALTINANTTQNFAATAVSSYDPGTYYSGATRQFWLDFSDSAKVLNASSASAANGVNVQFVQQESGAITQAIQATVGSQPVCATNVTNSKQGAVFNGSKFMTLQLSGADATAIIKNVSKVSFGAVFKLNGTGSNAQMLGCYDNSYSFRRFLPFLAANQPAVSGAKADGTAHSTLTSSTTLSTGVVHAVLWEWDVAAGTMTIYADNSATNINGTSFDVSGTIANTTLNEPRIGNLFDGTYLDAFLFTGLLNTNVSSWFAAVKTKFGITAY